MRSWKESGPVHVSGRPTSLIKLFPIGEGGLIQQVKEWKYTTQRMAQPLVTSSQCIRAGAIGQG